MSFNYNAIHLYAKTLATVVLFLEQAGGRHVGDPSSTDFTNPTSQEKDSPHSNLLDSLGNPTPIDTASAFPEGFRVGVSPWPCEKFNIRVPPPPQPSFLTANSILQRQRVSCLAYSSE